jgi:hypothetical protein
MKKIIAAAVATAFVAPAFAADVTLTGSQEFSLVSNQTTTATSDTAATDTAFTIKASTETANGLSISTDINMDGDGTHDGGNSINISGPMGSIVLGDDSGAGFDSKPKVDVSMSSAEGAARKYTASFFLTGEDSYALAA